MATDSLRVAMEVLTYWGNKNCFGWVVNTECSLPVKNSEMDIFCPSCPSLAKDLTCHFSHEHAKYSIRQSSITLV